jgi:hypothetical protein
MKATLPQRIANVNPVALAVGRFLSAFEYDEI